MQYMGSKSRIKKHLIPIIQEQVNHAKAYIEPFVGGANMIDSIEHEIRIGCDKNEYLIELLKMARDNVKLIPETISEDEYNRVKNNKHHYAKWYIGLVGFCATFGSKWFGGFARDKTEKRDVPAERCKNISKQSNDLQGIDFRYKTFDEIPATIKNAVIYCDPPYRGTTGYMTKEFNYPKFYRWCRKMAKHNVVFISEYNMPKSHFKCI